MPRDSSDDQEGFWGRLGRGEKLISLIAGLIAIAGAVFALANAVLSDNSNPQGGDESTTTTVAGTSVVTQTAVPNDARTTAPATARTDTAPPAPPPPAGPTKDDWIREADRICSDRTQANADAFAIYGQSIEYFRAALANSESTVSRLSQLERPPGDDGTLGRMIDYLDQSNGAAARALQYSAGTPEFEGYINQAAELEIDYEFEARSYGHRVCGAL